MSAVVRTEWYCTQMALCTHRAHCTSNQLMMECTNQKAANAVAPSPVCCVVTNKARSQVFLTPCLKVHKHEIILNFFLPESNPYMPFVNFRKKFRFCSFDFRQNFDVRTFPLVTEHFCWEISKKLFFKLFTLVLLDRFLDGFSKFWFFIDEICILIFESFSKIIACLPMLSIRGNDFIACWAYAEPISSHAEHTRNEFLRMLSQR